MMSQSSIDKKEIDLEGLGKMDKQDQNIRNFQRVMYFLDDYDPSANLNFSIMAQVLSFIILLVGMMNPKIVYKFTKNVAKQCKMLASKCDFNFH